MDKLIIYGDIDGVFADWNSEALKLYNLENNVYIQNYLKKGHQLEEKINDIRNKIANIGPQFWVNIKPFNWAQELYSKLRNLGDFCFLTSAGNHNKNSIYAANAAYGKLIWLSKHFKNAKVSICRDKHIHAHPNTILIDDSKENINKFAKHNGHTFLFPNAYKIIHNDLKFKGIYQHLEKTILQIKKSPN